MQRTHVAIPDGYREQVREIARKLAGLSPDYSNPHRYYARRDDLVDRLDRLSR
jgi:hypothetical protein